MPIIAQRYLLCVSAFFMIPKSEFLPSTMNQAPPDFELFLLPSDTIMVVCFCWMNATSGSDEYISLWFEINFIFHSSIDLILF